MVVLWLAYLWTLPAPAAGDLESRFAPPAQAKRVAVADGSFGAWLRHLPLLPEGAAVHLFDGRIKPRQDVHAAVVDLDVGKRDLQQCADAIMRLRAEYLYAAARGEDIRFHPEPGRVLAWQGGDRAAFEKYLMRVFAAAGTASLAAELSRPGPQAALAPGDVLIQGGHPGHAVMVLDAAEDGAGHRFVLLGQSYMPAQQFHVLRNPAGGAWFDAAALDGDGIATPEWRPFKRSDLRRFD